MFFLHSCHFILASKYALRPRLGSSIMKKHVEWNITAFFGLKSDVFSGDVLEVLLGFEFIFQGGHVE